ncbi:MAG: NUDIX-like domain-containing protein, partial [Caulobacteraceae bacterium]
MPLAAFTHTFAGNPLDRAGDRRGDAEWLARMLAAPDSLALAVWTGRPLIEDAKGGGAQIAWLAAGMARNLSGSPEHLLFLGLGKETAIFAVDLEGGADPTDGSLEGLGRFEDLRAIAASLPAGEAAMAATAKSMFDWRRGHRHCAACGEIAELADGGWKRVCPACRAEHFPRTDPVVIMLAVR